ncbi:MAG: aminotransferase class I/II-fold pyridoxal phosphate-dependent enzyme [Spirochaetaceae bacterium]|jgi:aspartate/methionine/tyrosine aminotransferase|nr:aminotransferase class I/II-fold pyridoxal phosphate-dependent enzyme [Spirochaetaceae bacterium]
MNDLAKELNSVLDQTVAGRLMSELGRRMYFPRGIIAQSAEAKQQAGTANATIGMAYSKGKPLLMSAISSNLPQLLPEETVAYAPTAGVEKVRQAWKELILQKNTSINAEHLSLPVVVPGITAGISYTAELFLDEGGTIVASSPCWDNYGLIFRERRGAKLLELPLFNGGKGLDLDAIGAGLREAAKGGSLRVILNFPNNPSGYSPSKAEEDALVELLRDIAEAGTDVLVLCDDAYFGLFYEDGIIQESIFGRLVNLHERILAIKIDGPTKEDYAWGFRMAFVTLGSRGLGASHWDAVIKKYMGFIRSSVSCANTPAQYLMLKTMEDPRTAAEKERFFALLKGRYRAVKRFIESRPPHPALAPLPFNSGYFMSFRCEGIDAEALRRELLTRGIGVIALEGRYLRITFAAIEEEDMEKVYGEIYEAAGALAGKSA